jgi:hypothetical protein
MKEIKNAVIYNVLQIDAPGVDPLVPLVCLIQTKRIPEKINIETVIPRGPGNEYPPHLRAKQRLGQILKEAGYENIYYETQQAKIRLQFLGERRYIADITAQKEGKHYIFEIDGKRGHSSKWNLSKDKARDRAMLVSLGKRTIRIQTGWLIGRGQLSDMDILKEIDWQMNE